MSSEASQTLDDAYQICPTVCARQRVNLVDNEEAQICEERSRIHTRRHEHHLH
ncbi:hypothetical protein LT988_23010 [Thiocapsa bogorovii]|nr:hypothetical protein [Thiocapsa bogorovii]UHD16083.1 hypothetical protein LT988_23010 [Thiocapsa bogorovii]